MSCTKIVYQLLIAVRFLAFIPGLILTVMSTLEADDSVAISFGYIALAMGGIHFLFMLAFGIRHIKNFGEFIKHSTSCCSLWIYLPEPATIAFLGYFCTLTSGDAQTFAIGAAAAFGLAFLIVFVVVCERRVFRKDIPDDTERLIHGRAHNSKSQKQQMRNASNKSIRQRDNYGQQRQKIPESENPYEELKNFPKSVHSPSKRHPAKRPNPRGPRLQDLVNSNSNNRSVSNTSRDRQRDKRIYGLDDMKIHSINNSRHSSNLNGDYGGFFSSHGPPLRYSGSYPGSTFYFNGEGPPLGYSGTPNGPYNYSNGHTPPPRHNNRIPERTASDYSKRPQYPMYSGNINIPPDYCHFFEINRNSCEY